MAIVIGKMNEHCYYKQWNFGEPNFETTPYTNMILYNIISAYVIYMILLKLYNIRTIP